MLREVVGRLNKLNLPGMAVGLDRWFDDPANAQRSTLECLERLMDTHEQTRTDARTSRFFVEHGLPAHMTLAAYDLTRVNGLGLKRLAELQTLAWLDKGMNVVITGEPRTGKRHLACGLAVEAVRRGYTCRYRRFPALLDELDKHRHRGTPDQLFQQMIRPQLLVLGEFGLVPAHKGDALWLRRVVERRATERRSTVITSPLKLSAWWSQIEDLPRGPDEPSLGDAIVGRLLHGAHHVRLRARPPGFPQPARSHPPRR